MNGSVYGRVTSHSMNDIDDNVMGVHLLKAHHAADIQNRLNDVPYGGYDGMVLGKDTTINYNYSMQGDVWAPQLQMGRHYNRVLPEAKNPGFLGALDKTFSSTQKVPEEKCLKVGSTYMRQTYSTFL